MCSSDLTIGDVMAGVGPQGARLQAMISGLVDSVGSGLGGLLSPERVTAAFGALLDVMERVIVAVRASVGPLLDGLSQGFGSVGSGTQTWQQSLQGLLDMLPAVANGLGLVVGYSARITAGFAAATFAGLALLSWFRSIPTELAFIGQSFVQWFTEIGTQIIDGTANIREINKALDWHLPCDGPKTLNGLITEALENLPDSSVCLKIGPYRLEVLQLAENRVKSVRIWPAGLKPATAAEA